MVNIPKKNTGFHTCQVVSRISSVFADSVDSSFFSSAEKKNLLFKPMTQQLLGEEKLVDGFNPYEKYARQIGSFSQVGVKIKNI